MKLSPQQAKTKKQLKRKNGETILHYEGDWDDWRPHPEGVIILKDNQFLLNGAKLLYEGECDSWWSHPEGMVIRKDNQLLLNGTKLLYEGRWDDWQSHPEGVIIRKGADWIFYK